MTPIPDDLRSEALLYAEWVRGAVGRFAVGEPAAGGGPGSATASRATAARSDRGTGVGVANLSSPPVSPELEGRAGAGAAAEPSLASSPREDRSGFVDNTIIRPMLEISDKHFDSAGFEALRASALCCQRCRLCATRTQVVFGEGALRPRLLVVGEAPGADEDATGRPFVGKAGQLLTRMLAAIGLGRDDVYIANVLKCRPPDNRPPAPDEILACRPFLREQIERLRPELLLLLGNHATRAVLATDRGITSLRGRLMASPEGWRTLPTFHPAYLLRNPDAKRDAWADLQLAATTLGLTVPGRSSPGAPGEALP